MWPKWPVKKDVMERLRHERQEIKAVNEYRSALQSTAEVARHLEQSQASPSARTPIPSPPSHRRDLKRGASLAFGESGEDASAASERTIKRVRTSFSPPLLCKPDKDEQLDSDEADRSQVIEILSQPARLSPDDDGDEAIVNQDLRRGA